MTGTSAQPIEEMPSGDGIIPNGFEYSFAFRKTVLTVRKPTSGSPSSISLNI